MQTRTLIIAAGILLTGCATKFPSLPSGAPGASPSSSTSQGSSEQTSESRDGKDKPVGQAQPLERDRVESQGARLGRNGQSGDSDQTTEQPPPKTIGANASPAVMSLVQATNKAMGQQDAERAGSLIERALNLEPRNPFLYQRLAAIRLAQEQPGQAVQLARKSNSLASDNPFVKQKNWRLVANAQKARDQGGEARQAVLKAKKFKRIGQNIDQ